MTESTQTSIPPAAVGADFGETRGAVIQTLPLFEMMRMRAATTARRHPTLGFASEQRDSTLRWVNQFTHTHRRLGPEDREVVSPNNDTVYSNAWLDLADGPVLIESPEMGDRYWTLGLLDAWTNPFEYVGRRTSGNRPQRTLVHGPGWQGSVPDDVTRVIAAPGMDVWIIGRVLVESEADVEVVRGLQTQLRLRRLDGSDAASRLDTRLDARDSSVPSAHLYRATVDEALERDPPSAGDSLRWPQEVERLADAVPHVYEDLRSREQPHDLGGGWAIPVRVRTHWHQDYLTRARVARNLIGALGIEEAMYPTAEVDAEGRPLNGSHAYELRFAPGAGPQVGAFWSLTMYRRSDCLLVANPIGRHSIGDRTPGLRHEPDGSLSIRLQADDPGSDQNWLPSPPGEQFYVVLRLYQPQAIHLEDRFAYPPLRRV
ncbi:conserved hypothetical protein [Burkholderiales bacterium 8X]|nr:conserved hypothetical protein [Burkholderiales bacterium 8X]